MPMDHRAGSTVLVDERRVRRLQRLRSQGSVSILLHCNGRVDVDERRLRELMQQAHRRVQLEVGPDAADTILAALDEAGEHAVVPGVTSVALFASEMTSAVVHLDVVVPTRVVVDDTFATRDLLLALHHQPETYVVTLGERLTRCFVGRGVHLEQLHDGHFPFGLDLDVEEDRAGVHERSPSLDRYAREVERRLRASLPDDGAPLVVVGSPRRVAAVARRPWLGRRPVRTVQRQMERSSPEELSVHVGPVVESVVEARRAWGLDAAREAVGRHRAAVGIHDVWLASVRGHVQTLVVERGYHVAVRLHPDGVTFARTDDVTEPGVVDDLVDEVIEQVIATRGGVEIVDDGQLAHAERITAVLRHPTPAATPTA